MTKSLWFKRTALLMCLLVLFLCLAPGFQQPAKAVALVDDVALFLIGALAVSGITLIISQGGLSGAIDWVSQKFDDYLDSLSLQLDTVLTLWDWIKLRTGLSTDSDSAQLVSGFVDYVVTDESLVDNSSHVLVSSEYFLGDTKVFLAPDTYQSNGAYPSGVSSFISDSNVYFFCTSAGVNLYRFVVFSQSSFTATVDVGSSQPYSFYNTATEGSWLYTDGGPLSGRNNDLSHYFTGLSSNSLISLLRNYSSISSSPGYGFSTGSISVPAIPVDQSLGLSIPGVTPTDTLDDVLSVLSDLIADNDIDTVTGSLIDPLNPPGPSEVSLDPAQFPLPVVVQGSVTTVLGGGSISINNGAEDAIPVYLPGGITLTWPTDGLPIDWPADGIPIDWGDAPSITMDLPDTFFDDLTGAISDALDESYGLANQYKSPGLSDIFPFCIPFDIYHFFEALAADPVAPCFEIPFYVEGLVDYTFEIDLSVFESVAQVVRIMELLLFCVGLALVTRNLIRG